MRAMILAAGRGERMGALTAQTPKPLLTINGEFLIVYAICNLARAGIKDIVMNVSYHGEQSKEVIGGGSRYGVKLIYSEEETRLETGGGILNALPLLGRDPFIVVSADVVTDFALAKLPRQLQGLAHLVMVDNPSFHPKGDFALVDGFVCKQKDPTFTYANIGVYHPDLFSQCEPGYFPLNKVLLPAIQKRQVTGEYYQGIWYNVGTKEDLDYLNLRARENSNLLPII